MYKMYNQILPSFVLQRHRRRKGASVLKITYHVSICFLCLSTMFSLAYFYFLLILYVSFCLLLISYVLVCFGMSVPNLRCFSMSFYVLLCLTMFLCFSFMFFFVDRGSFQLQNNRIRTRSHPRQQTIRVNSAAESTLVSNRWSQASFALFSLLIPFFFK